MKRLSNLFIQANIHNKKDKELNNYQSRKKYI